MKKLLLILFFPSVCLGAGNVDIKQGSGGGTITIQQGSGGGGGGGTPGGSDTNVQFNNSGSFGGDNGFQYDSSVSSITLASGIGAGGAITINGTLTPHLSLLSPNFDDALIGFATGFQFDGVIDEYFGIRSSGGGQADGDTGVAFFDSSLVPRIDFTNNGYLQSQRLNVLGKVGYAYPLTMNASGTLDPDNYYVRSNATSGNVVITLPNITSVSTPQTSRYEYIFCKTDASANTVSFAAGTSDALDSSVPTLGTQNECTILISSVTSGTDNGTWFSAMYSKPNASSGGSGGYLVEPSTLPFKLAFGFSTTGSTYTTLSPGVMHTASNSSATVTGLVLSTEMANTAVSPGSYTNTNLTVDQQGRITSASNGSASGVSQSSATIYLSATSGLCQLVAGCTDPDQYQTSVSSVNYMAATFTGGTTQYWQTNFEIPSNYVSGSTFTATITWSSTATVTSSNWNIDMQAQAHDQTLDGTWGTAVQTTSTTTAVRNLMKTPESPAITCANTPGGGKQLYIRIYRGNLGDARFHGVRIVYTKL